MRRGVRLRPRLEAAARLLPQGCGTVADIGCDHGRLGVALLQRGACARVIATDVGEAPLARAASLYALCGLEERVSLRLGDGFAPLAAAEVDAAMLCGMGGTLMARLLAACDPPLAGARACVMQPMRGIEDIRNYLFSQGYRITEDCVVRDAGRYYQVFCAVPGERDTLPAGWPEGCFLLGHRALVARDPLLPALAREMLAQHMERLIGARGTPGEARLAQKADWLRRILALAQAWEG